MARVYKAIDREEIDKFTETDTLIEMIRKELAKPIPNEEI